MSKHQVPAPVATHFYTFDHGGRMADALEHGVCAIPASEFANGIDSARCIGKFLDVDGVVCPEATRHREAIGRSANHNRRSSAGTFRYGESRNAHRPRSLDDDGVTPLNSRS